MNTTELMNRGVEVLQTCEQSLQEVIGQAVAARDYAAVMELTSIAKAVAELAGSVTGASSGRQAPFGAAETYRPAMRKKTSSYPRFLRRGDDLVKIGWSKKEKKEYQHKAPRRIIDVLVAALAKVGQNGSVFTTDKLVEAAEPGDGSPIPEYQMYVALAWLKELGLIDQHGRQGYSVPRVATLRQAVETAWKEITEG